jgi:arginine:ornithine antiporter/lysine permease
MIMIPYLFSALYYAKVVFKKEGELANYSAGALAKEKIIALVGSIYGIWMLYSGGLDYLLATTALYALGIIIFALGRKERNAKVFSKGELAIAIVICVLAAVAVYLIATGSLQVF